MAKVFKQTKLFPEIFAVSYPVNVMPGLDVVNKPEQPIKRWYDPDPKNVVKGWDGQDYAQYTMPKMNGTAYTYTMEGLLVVETTLIPVAVAKMINPPPVGNVGPNVNIREIPVPLDMNKLAKDELIVRSQGLGSITGAPVIGIYVEQVSDSERLASIEGKVDEVIKMLKVIV
jgi:hypothetical protein